MGQAGRAKYDPSGKPAAVIHTELRVASRAEGSSSIVSSELAHVNGSWQPVRPTGTLTGVQAVLEERHGQLLCEHLGRTESTPAPHSFRDWSDR